MDKLIKNIKQYLYTDSIAYGIIGSYARKEQTPYSDLDIFVVSQEKHETNIRMIDGVYATITYHTIEQLENYITNPEQFIRYYDAFHDMYPIEDSNGIIMNLIQKMDQIEYHSAFKIKINQYVNHQTMAWFEEVNKAISGYVENHPGKMLLGLHGLTFGMTDVLFVHQGIIMKSEHDLITALKIYFKQKPNIIDAIEIAFGVRPATLKERVINGLTFYIEIIKIIEDVFDNTVQNSILYIVKNIYTILK